MKQIWIFMVALFTYVSFAALAFAQDVPVEGMEWLTQVIHFLSAIPQAQPVLGTIFVIAGVLTVGLTALAVFLETILTIPQVVAKFSGAENLAEKIKKFKEKVLPWIKYFSMFNVQKKK